MAHVSMVCRDPVTAPLSMSGTLMITGFRHRDPNQACRCRVSLLMVGDRGGIVRQVAKCSGSGSRRRS